MRDPTKRAPPVQTKARSIISRNWARRLAALSQYYRRMNPSNGSRVVVSGIGVVSPFGVGRERFWEHVSRGCSGTRAIGEFDASGFACRVAAPVEGVTIDDLPRL